MGGGEEGVAYLKERMLAMASLMAVCLRPSRIPKTATMPQPTKMRLRRRNWA
jgi:hypothetical protein